MSRPFVDNTRRASFSLLRRRARQAYRAGRFEEALALYDQAWQWAKTHGNADDVDRAFCGRASVAIEIGSADPHVAELRAILLRSRSDENCFLAANNIGRAYELKRDHKKCEFYARIARDRAELLGSREWLASAHNLLGNACLAESRTEEARQEYLCALDLIPPAMKVWRALIDQNLGYAAVVSGDLRTGFGLLYGSLRALRSAGALRYPTAVHVDLAFAHLEANRPLSALRHARRAADVAAQEGDSETRKNALYLLGEAANQLRMTAEARDSYARLQQEFFPASRNLPELLLGMSVRNLVSLRA